MIQGFSGYLSNSLKLACFIAFHFCDSESIIQFVLFITLTAYQSLLKTYYYFQNLKPSLIEDLLFQITLHFSI